MTSGINDKIESLAEFLLQDNSIDYGLYGGNGGNGGKTLFFLYYYRHTKDAKWKNLFNSEIDLSLDYLANDCVDYSFCRGITGYLHLYNFIHDKMGIEFDIMEAESYYSEYLMDKMMGQIQIGHYDFLYSSLGIAYYFLLKMNIPYIEKYIEALFNMGHADNDSFYWIDKFNPDVEPKLNIGLAHGMSSIVIFLSKVYSKNIKKELVGKMLNTAINYIMSQKITLASTDLPNLYPTCSLADSNLHSRLGWCYGDLSIALALWQAGNALNNEKYKLEALNILYHTKNRLDLKENFVFDASLCHGTSGIAHIFRRFYYETKDQFFLSLSDHWIDMTLKQGMNNDSPSGYKTLEDNGYVDSDYSLINGLSGIALILLSSITSRQCSDWDCLYLIS